MLTIDTILKLEEALKESGTEYEMHYNCEDGSLYLKVEGDKDDE